MSAQADWAMLSRVAESLFWIGRYVERAENVARLVDVARRMSGLPRQSDRSVASEWSSVVIASGAHHPFGEALDRVTAGTAIDRLIFDQSNPSSVTACFTAARENARAVRFAITQEMWEALNTAWSEMRSTAPEQTAGGGLSDLLDWVKAKTAAFRGTVQGTMLRGDGYSFLDMGMAIERVDCTARLLDVKYHVLLPSAQDVGSSADHYQWLSLLQAAAAQRAYFAVTGADISARGVAEFLILNRRFPRSILFNLNRAESSVASLEAFYERESGCRAVVAYVANELQARSIEDIITFGLHEFLTDVIERNYEIANALGQAYGFAPAIDEDSASDEPSGQ